MKRDGADRIEALERALARIRDRAVGEFPEPENSPDERLQTIYIIAVSALAGFADPADLQ